VTRERGVKKLEERCYHLIDAATAHDRKTKQLAIYECQARQRCPMTCF